MEIHYFQRYHEKENVATANTMLLLSRFYHYSQRLFFEFLSSFEVYDDFQPEIIFRNQPKGKGSIPDASITQKSFKIVVETKIPGKGYDLDQLKNHLNSFSNEEYQMLLTIARDKMPQELLNDFNTYALKYNGDNNARIKHINTTFEEIAKLIKENLDDRDYEMEKIVSDYESYLNNDGLTQDYDSWKYLRMQLSGETFDFNVKNNVYFDKAERGFRPHDYLGLYKNKSVRAIGRIIAKVTAEANGTEILYHKETGDLNDDRKKVIKKAIEEFDLGLDKYRFFFVDKFFETDFQKDTPGGSMGTKIFDLSEELGIEKDKLPKVEDIATRLNGKKW